MAKPATSKKAAPAPAGGRVDAPDDALPGALAAAAWAEADLALAHSLQSFSELENSVETLARSANVEPSRIEEIEGRLLLTRQALEHVARTRGLRRLGAAGDVMAYDPEHHELISAARAKSAPKRVKIRVAAIVRGSESRPETLLKAQVEAAPAPRRASTRRPR